MSDLWSELKRRTEELESLAGAMGLLEWDQQTGMPAGGAAGRARQIAALSAIYHERLTHPAVGEIIDGLSGETDPTHAAAVRVLRRRYERAVRVPTQLVQAFASATSEGFAAWMRAREARSFAPFQPALERILDLIGQTSACYGPVAHPYDHLLEDYDPGCTTAWLKPTFARLEGELSTFVRSIADRPAPQPLDVSATEAAGMALSKRVITALGFDNSRGRIDTSQHPFTCGMNSGDVRITTHLRENNLWGTLFGTIHECGHAMYEQGLPESLVGTGLSHAAGTGMHESQSRLWENFIGRSLPFCRWLAPILREEIPAFDASPERLYQAINRVHPSLIRIHADEVTYNLHILIRFELECALVSGELAVADLPEAWNAAYAHNLGVQADNPVDGVLQDVHWSSGLLGYFPSYTLGNLYASSMMATMQTAIPDLWNQVEAGDFTAVLAWLRKNVHSRGHTVESDQIMADAVGKRDPVTDFMAHVQARHGVLYGV